MPLKWKVYYWCCIYCLVFNLATVGFTGYGIIQSYETPRDILLVLIPAVMLLKPLLSLKFIVALKKGAALHEDYFFFFTAMFVLNVIYTIIACILFVEFIAHW